MITCHIVRGRTSMPVLRINRPSPDCKNNFITLLLVKKKNGKTNLFNPPVLFPEVGSYTGIIGVLVLGVNAYECTIDIKEFRRPSSLDDAAANIIQSTTVRKGQPQSSILVDIRTSPAQCRVPTIKRNSEVTGRFYDRNQNVLQCRESNFVPNCEI